MKSKAIACITGYVIIVCLFILLLESTSFFISKFFLAEKAVFFDKSKITQNYADYLNKRNQELGWINSNADRYGAREDKTSFKNSAVCVDVYGDSFTYSGEVADEFAYPNVLSELLRCRVRNFGVSGYGSDQALMRFLHSKNDANIVILNHLSENVVRNINQFRNFIYPGNQWVFKPRFIVIDGKLSLIPTPEVAEHKIPIFLSSPQEFLFHEYFLPGGDSGIRELSFPYTYNLVRAFEHWHLKTYISRENRLSQFYDSAHPSDGLRVTAKIFENFFITTKKRGGQPILVVIPTCRDFELLDNIGFFPYQNLSEIAMATYDKYFIDVGKEILALNINYRNLYSHCSGHFNETGYRVLAKIVRDRLEELKLLK